MQHRYDQLVSIFKWPQILISLFDIAKRLGIKVKTLTAEYLYTLVRDKKVSYEAIKEIEPKKFGDLEYTMKLIFNHDED